MFWGTIISLWACLASPIFAQYTVTDSIDKEEQQAEDSRVKWELCAITEGQWNMTDGKGGWANRVDANLQVGLWQGATLSTGILSTYRPTEDVTEVMQDFSNINAQNRPLRLVHFGLEQKWKNFSAFAGLRQADEDYFCSPIAGIATGASCGCVPTVNDNFVINVFPMTAMGVHFTYTPTTAWLAQVSVYNGKAYDTLNRSFRFRPHTDGILSLGSITYTPTTADAANDNAFVPTYLLGWNIGNHQRDDTETKHTQVGYWITAEQPIGHLGRMGVALAATISHQIKDPETAKFYYNATLAMNNLTRRGGTLAVLVNRAYYSNAHETELEATFTHPLGKYFSLQPALHYYSTSGKKQMMGSLRVILNL